MEIIRKTVIGLMILVTAAVFTVASLLVGFETVVIAALAYIVVIVAINDTHA